MFVSQRTERRVVAGSAAPHWELGWLSVCWKAGSSDLAAVSLAALCGAALPCIVQPGPANMDM